MYPEPMVTISFNEYLSLKNKIDESNIDDMLAVFGAVYTFCQQRSDCRDLIDKFIHEQLPTLKLRTEPLPKEHPLLNRLNRQLAQKLIIEKNGKSIV